MGIPCPTSSSNVGISCRYIVCSSCQRVPYICHISAVDPKPPFLYVASRLVTLLTCTFGGMGLSMSWHTDAGSMMGLVRHIFRVPL